MSLSSLAFNTRTGGYTTTLANKLDKIDCSQVLASILLKDTALLGQIKIGSAGTTIEHNWIEDDLNSPYFYAKIAASTKITIIATKGITTAMVANIARKYSLVQPRGSEWVAQLTGTNSNGITCATYGKTTGRFAAVTTVTKVWVVGSPYRDIDSASSDISKSRSKCKNFMQIFERAIEITQTRENMDMEAVANELQLQIQNRTYEIKRELNIAALRGIAYYSSAYSGRVERSTMMGIENFIYDPDFDGTEEALTVIDAGTNAALTAALINSLANKIYGYGGMDEQSDCFILVPPNQARIIAAMEKELRRVEQGERQVGYYRNKFITDLGYELPIVIDRFASDDKLYILDRNRLALIPMQGDAWHLEKMAKTGRSTKWQLSGQYTLEVRNANAVHGMITDLAA
jgi:hypothetical protein